MSEIKYTQVRTLRCRGPVDNEPDQEVEGSLLVGDVCAISYRDRQSHCGEDSVRMYPAFHRGEQCWLETRSWLPSHGYSAEGDCDTIRPFADGIAILAARGVYQLPVPSASAGWQ